MTPSIAHPLDVAFVFAVTAAGMVHPIAALIVGAAFFGLNAVLYERRRTET